MSEMKYDRQDIIPGWDQEKLLKTKVAIVGAGALGNHVALGLIGLGIGTIKIFDPDKIEPHNLNRQSLFCEDDIGKNKALVLAERLKERNRSIFVLGYEDEITEDNIDILLEGIDIVIDCVDLIYVRKILSLYCLEENIPLVHGGIGWNGGQAAILTRETPCINCIYPREIQEMELEEITSCIDKPQPSVVYVSQIIGGIMVYLVRRLIIPLEKDPPLGSHLIKVDFSFPNLFYLERIRRKETCECVQILKEVAPEILEKEEKDLKIEKEKEADRIRSLLDFETSANKK